MVVQLLSCNSDLGNCCKDYALVGVLDLVRRIVDVIQLIAPILLLVMASVQLTRLVMNPELKGGLKGLINKFIAAAVIFFIPMVVNVVMNMLPVEFSLSACWDSSKIMREISQANSSRYVALSDQKASSILPNPNDYQNGVPSSNIVNDGTVHATGAGGQRIVNVALGEIGNTVADGSHHKYEAYSGISNSQPWCAAFVTWCAGQAGFLDKGIFPRFVSCSTGFRQFKQMGADVHSGTSSYTPQPGDIIFYSWSGTDDLDHVGIVVSSDGTNVTTVEGNASCSGEAVKRCNGKAGVSLHNIKKNNTIYAFVTPRYGG